MSIAWPTSEQLFRRAQQLMPGGVNSPARAFKAVGGHPLFIREAHGPFLWDEDGRRYIDYIGSWGPMILGHRHPSVVEAVERELKRGMSYGAPTQLEILLAEQIVEIVPSVEMVRMVNSGTEATMSTIRLARGYTGRDVIVKFAGCYHGHVDALLVEAGSGALTLGVPNSPGIPTATTQSTAVLEYNDVEAVTQFFAQHGPKVAAVILEPVVGNMGLVAPKPEFLRALRDITQRDGALLIFDEVMTGFRLALGGAQERFGITPDLTALGKIIGGGMPVGAYGGPTEIMKHVSPVGPVYQAGTLSGNPIAMASGLATLQQLRRDPPYERLEKLSSQLAEGLHQAADEAGIPHSVPRVGSMMTLFFNPNPVEGYRIACQSDTKRFSQFFWGMMRRGVYWPCSQFEALFVSDAHTEELIEETIAAARETLAELS